LLFLILITMFCKTKEKIKYMRIKALTRGETPLRISITSPAITLAGYFVIGQADSGRDGPRRLWTLSELGILAPPSKQYNEFDACLMKMHSLKRIVKPDATNEYERPSKKNHIVRCNTR